MTAGDSRTDPGPHTAASDGDHSGSVTLAAQDERLLEAFATSVKPAAHGCTLRVVGIELDTLARASGATLP